MAQMGGAFMVQMGGAFMAQMGGAFMVQMGGAFMTNGWGIHDKWVEHSWLKWVGQLRMAK